jgi:hypothetical protein
MIDATKIKAHMPIVCSENGQFAVVDHMEGTNVIKVAKDKAGHHHYIPLNWVTSVDTKVHIDRTGDQAMREWWSSPPEALNGALEGEGSYSAARRYDEGVQRSVEKGDAEKLGKEAARALDSSEGKELRKAEKAAKHGHAH